MELLPRIIVNRCALYIKDAKTIVISDLHIGKEEEMRSMGMMILASQKKYYHDEVRRLLQAHDVECVVLNGDIKHEFSRISQQEWSDVSSFIEFIKKLGVIVKVIVGNHDNMILPILEKNNIVAQKEILIGDILVTHGDSAFNDLKCVNQAKSIIIGHEHPTLLLDDGVRSEKVKCFLVGEQQGKKVIVMPAFNPLSSGSDVLRERPLGPLLESYIGFSAFALEEDEVLAFGLIENIQRHQS